VTRTRRLVVTTWMPGDVDDLHKLHSDPLTMRFVGPGRPETREECDHRLASYLNEQRTRGWTKWRLQTPKGSMIGRAGFGAYGPNRELGTHCGPTHGATAWPLSWHSRWCGGTPRTRIRTVRQICGHTRRWRTSRAAGFWRRSVSTLSTTGITMALRVRSTFSHMGRDSDERADLAAFRAVLPAPQLLPSAR